MFVGTLSRGEKWALRVLAVLLGGFITVMSVLIVVGVVQLGNGAGEAGTSIADRIIFGVIDLPWGLGMLVVGVSGRGVDDIDGSSSDPEYEGVHVEGEVVAEVIDGDFDGDFDD